MKSKASLASKQPVISKFFQKKPDASAANKTPKLTALTKTAVPTLTPTQQTTTLTSKAAATVAIRKDAPCTPTPPQSARLVKKVAIKDVFSSQTSSSSQDAEPVDTKPQCSIPTGDAQDSSADDGPLRPAAAAKRPAAKRARNQVRRVLVDSDDDNDSDESEYNPRGAHDTEVDHDKPEATKKESPSPKRKRPAKSIPKVVEKPTTKVVASAKRARNDKDDSTTPVVKKSKPKPQPQSKIAGGSSKRAKIQNPTETKDTKEQQARAPSADETAPTKARDVFDTKPLDFNRPQVKAETFGSKLRRGTKDKYTPLEAQFVQVKSKYPDAVLAVEVGYKYKFFGVDAEIAAKELKIQCYHAHNFMNASIPSQRLYVHVRHLVECGYKVGVVGQSETAALKKAGDNKASLFTRELKQMFTKSTMLGEEIDTSHESDHSDLGGSNFLMCIHEQVTDAEKHLSLFSVVAISLATGEIIYDTFQDDTERTELSTRISHIRPVEVLVSENVSSRTKSYLKNLTSSLNTAPRVEVISSKYYSNEASTTTLIDLVLEENRNAVNATLLRLGCDVQLCLNVLAHYLQDFGLAKVFDLVAHAKEFSRRGQNMWLNGATLKNLEVFHNGTNQLSKGSLFWVLNQTHTSFGSRLMRKWVAAPLGDAQHIRNRVDAVEALMGENKGDFEPIISILKKLPDLQRCITSIFYRKCSTLDFYGVMESLDVVVAAVSKHKAMIADNCSVKLLVDLVETISSGLEDVPNMMGELNKKAAQDNDKVNLFADDSFHPKLKGLKENMVDLKKALKQHLKQLRTQFNMSKLEYVTVSGDEYLVELPKNGVAEKKVPKNWSLAQSTSKVVRYRSPFMIEKLEIMARVQEKLDAEAAIIWSEYLGLFADKFDDFKNAVNAIATFDCLQSLAKVSNQPGYVKPNILDDTAAQCINIVGGRNPVVAALLDEGQFVCNDTSITTDSDGARCHIITGPNMGGKSCYIRQVALISIMSQIGCFVPAESATLRPLDAVFTRMGAEDNIFARESTFMHELNEASQILKHATERSLVIMDELGRGTSTHDGVAIAYATCAYLVNVNKCLTLFVTHYPSIAELAVLGKSGVANFHMDFMENAKENEECAATITFLYKVVAGAAGKSYGLNVAKLANIPDALLILAAKKSAELEAKVQASSNPGIKKLSQLFSALNENDVDVDVDTVINLESSLLGSSRT